MRLLFILGTNSELSKKEIEAAATILPLQWSLSSVRPGTLELKSENELHWETEGIAGYLSQEAVDLRKGIGRLQARLGGTIQIILLLRQSTLRSAPTDIVDALGSVPIQATRWKLAVRAVGSTVDPERLALQVKRELKGRGLTLRYLPSRSGVAGVYHEKLDLNRFDPIHPGIELTVLAEGQGLWLGVTLSVQHLDEYSRRDFGIPSPDPTSGMLPPKLAQIMINLCLGDAGEQAIVYDPFCGNGRIVLEAAEMGFLSFGSDISAQKVTATLKNLDWLLDDVSAQPELRVWQDDATSPDTISHFTAHLASQTELFTDERRFIVTEPYLGRPLRAALEPKDREGWLRELADLYLKFFEIWKDADFEAMLVVFPAAKVNGGPEANLLNFLFDRLVAFGYAPKRLAQYARPDAYVARDLVRLTNA